MIRNKAKFGMVRLKLLEENNSFKMGTNNSSKATILS